MRSISTLMNRQIRTVSRTNPHVLSRTLRPSDSNRAAVLWFKCGHQISIEEKKKLIDFRSLAQSVTHFKEEEEKEVMGRLCP